MARYSRDIHRGRHGPYDVGYRGAGAGRGGYERGFAIGPTWGGGSDIGYRTGRSRGYETERDLGDRIQEGWDDMKRRARQAFGGAYDREYRGSSRQQWNRGGYQRYGRDFGPMEGGGPARRGGGAGRPGSFRDERWETTRPGEIAERNFYRR